MALPRASRFLVPAVILLAASVALYVGWRALWFLTDDAFIAFRYVSNRQLGFGYVWNAPPFLPVEGYTSFLWVVLLDLVWSLLAIEPPQSSNALAFAFGLGTLALTAAMVLRMRLASELRDHRSWFLFVVLAGLVTNVSFLVWTSSGLETSLFNFLFLAWVASVVYLQVGSRAWLAGLSVSASLLALTRPDGMLVVAATVALVLACAALGPRPPRTYWLAVCPLALPLAHLLWRRSFYGEWLPNTYHAKHVAAWPAAGIRYFASYVLEYGLWLWAALALATLLLGLGWGSLGATLRNRESLRRLLPALVVPATLAVHLAYYTLSVGGDHFEYRVYSHTVAPLLVSTVWMVDRLVEHGRLRVSLALLVPLLVVAASWPLPWTYATLARTRTSRAQTFNMTIPLAERFPLGTRWYVRLFDGLQDWLIVGHGIGKRHQEHKVFYFWQSAAYPRERLMGREWYDEHRVYVAGTVGVPGWILARGHVIDNLGLNDYVVARNPVRPSESRRMAHDRFSPEGYEEGFKPDVTLDAWPRTDLDERTLGRLRSPGFTVHPRESPLTANEIIEHERRWRDWIATTDPVP